MPPPERKPPKFNYMPGLYPLMCITFGSRRCKHFATCTADSSDSDITGTSQVNADVLALYQEGQVKLLDGDCEGVENTKNKIVDLMTVPLLQGLLRCVPSGLGLGAGCASVGLRTFGVSFQR